ncbi:putative uncharacterized protein DDB_G0286901 [Mercenaria mercenaria]|uniref:putative uncharacterized protein DDB_G0286901 n=1 Tax=Mercenaria mercenaria TaxID=6596 RepID=UPI00234EE55F|nr:putative uncharacterized protein DDB_G0286901 [Mercenaria mercenaria]
MAEATGREITDAKDYVDSVMYSGVEQSCVTPNNRKRHRSESGLADVELETSSTVKKSKCDERNSNSSVIGEARRTLYGKNPRKSCEETKTDGSAVCDYSSSDTDNLSKLIMKLSRDVSTLNTDMNCRNDKLETTLESKICHKIGNLIDKRVNAEVSRLKSDINMRINAFTEDIRQEMADMEGKVKNILEISNANVNNSEIRKQNVAVRGLPYHEGENLNVKVNSLIKDGIGIKNVSVLKTERKTVENSDKPGVVIATFQSMEDRRKVLSVKNKLKDSNQYDGVFISKDMSFDERSTSRNFMVIVNALRENGCNISLQGNRVVQQRNNGKNGRYNASGRQDRSPYRDSSRYNDQDTGASGNVHGDRDSFSNNLRNRGNYNSNNNDRAHRNDVRGSFSGNSKGDHGHSDRRNYFSGNSANRNDTRDSFSGNSVGERDNIDDSRDSFSGNYAGNSGRNNRRRGRNNRGNNRNNDRNR